MANQRLGESLAAAPSSPRTKAIKRERLASSMVTTMPASSCCRYPLIRRLAFGVRGSAFGGNNVSNKERHTLNRPQKVRNPTHQLACCERQTPNAKRRTLSAKRIYLGATSKSKYFFSRAW